MANGSGGSGGHPTTGRPTSAVPRLSGPPGLTMIVQAFFVRVHALPNREDLSEHHGHAGLAHGRATGPGPAGRPAGGGDRGLARAGDPGRRARASARPAAGASWRPIPASSSRPPTGDGRSAMTTARSRTGRATRSPNWRAFAGDSAWPRPGTPTDPEACPFQGGLIGFLGYDLAPLLERLPRKADRDSRLPDLRMALYDTAVTVDHQTGKVDLARLGPDRRGTRGRRAAVPVLAAGPAVGDRISPAGPDLGGWVRSAATSPRRLISSGVRRALEYIAAGDVFQVNLSQRFTAQGSIEPLDLFLRLRRGQPRPVLGLPALGRPGGRLGQPGVVLPDPGRPGRDPADQGNSAARQRIPRTTRGWPPSWPHRPRIGPS